MIRGIYNALAGLALSTGSALIGFIQAGTGAVSRTVQSKLRDVVNVRDFGAVGDGSTDDTAAIQAAINYAQSSGPNAKTLRVPVGIYKITGTLDISENIQIIGDGSYKTVFKLYSGSVINAMLIGPTADNGYMWGSRFQGFSIYCNEGSARCDGIKTRTAAVNSVITQCYFDDIIVWQARDNWNLGGVIYMSEVSNCKAINTSRYGFFADGNTQEIVYNSFRNLEVTQVQSTGYSYYLTITGALLDNLTADGPAFFSIPYGNVRGLYFEGIEAATVVTSVLCQFDQIESAEDIAIINVPDSKCSTGILSTGAHSRIQGVRVPGGSSNVPSKIIDIGASSGGILSGVWVESSGSWNLLESYADATALESWHISDCDAITNIYSFGMKVAGSLPTPAAALKGNLLFGPKSGDSLYPNPYVCKLNRSGTYVWGKVLTWDGDSVTIGTDLSGGIAPLTLRNPAATAGKYWDVGPFTNSAFLVSNQATAGVVLYDGDTSWSAFSDERLKDIIEPITDAAAKVSTLRPVIGKYKTDPPGTRRSFLIAQDVQKVLPEAVSVFEPGPDGAGDVHPNEGKLILRTTDTIPLLVAAISELKAEFDAYKAAHP